MHCPTCDSETPLTWGRYLGSPLGSHACPGCGTRFRPRTTWRFYLVLLLAWLVVLGFSLWAMQRFHLPLSLTLALHLGLGCGLLLPLDRWLDDRVRSTRALPPRD